uniref:ZP domain-containing protein n=1 Tax=Rhabditophanes sp. KR3021 TaxID=114890 RepID=A0AC35UHM2_9BILA
MKVHYFCIFLIPAIFVHFIDADGFIESVECTSLGMTIYPNRSDPYLASWMSNANSDPVMYVQYMKANPACSNSIKHPIPSSNGSLVIPYGDICNLNLLDIGNNYQMAETHIYLEDGLDSDPSINNKVNHAFCSYIKSKTFINTNEIKTNNEIIQSTGGKPDPKISLLFKNSAGKELNTVKMGDQIELFITLSPDATYKAISPMECIFSDREDMKSPGSNVITIVQNGCPVTGYTHLVPALKTINGHTFFTKFGIFKINNQATLFIQCTIETCLQAEGCGNPCYKKVSNSSLTSEHLRHRRSSQSTVITEREDSDIADVKVIQKLIIYDDHEPKKIETRAVEQCAMPDSNEMISDVKVWALIGALSFAVAIMSAITFVTCRKLKTANKLNDISCYNSSGISPTGSVINNHPIGSLQNPNVYDVCGPSNWRQYIKRY